MQWITNENLKQTGAHMEDKDKDNSYEAVCFALEVAQMVKVLGTSEELQWAITTIDRMQTREYSHTERARTVARLEEMFDRYGAAYEEMTNSLTLIYTETLPECTPAVRSIELHNRAGIQPDMGMLIRMYSCLRTRMSAMIPPDQMALIDENANKGLQQVYIKKSKAEAVLKPFQDNRPLSDIWEKATQMYRGIENPDDLDKAVYGNIKTLAVKIGGGGSTDMKRLQELVDILEISVE